MTPDKILQKIQKLQRLAEDQAGLPEGEAAAEMARRLMVENDIDEVKIQDAADPNTKHHYNVGPHVMWRHNLLNAIASHCGVFMVRLGVDRSSTDKAGLYSNRSMAVLFGRHSGCQVATYLYEVLARQVENAADHHIALKRASTPWLTNGDIRRTRSGFCASAVVALATRFMEMRETERTAEPGVNALMIRRGTEAEEYAKAQMKFTSSGKINYRYNAAGYAAGAKMPINPAVEGRRDTKTAALTMKPTIGQLGRA